MVADCRETTENIVCALSACMCVAFLNCKQTDTHTYTHTATNKEAVDILRSWPMIQWLKCMRRLQQLTSLASHPEGTPDREGKLASQYAHRRRFVSRPACKRAQVIIGDQPQQQQQQQPREIEVISKWHRSEVECKRVKSTHPNAHNLSSNGPNYQWAQWGVGGREGRSNISSTCAVFIFNSQTSDRTIARAAPCHSMKHVGLLDQNTYSVNQVSFAACGCHSMSAQKQL